MLYQGRIWRLLLFINGLPEIQNLFASMLSHNHLADVKEINITRHCEERSDAAIQKMCKMYRFLDCFVGFVFSQ